MKNVAIHDQLMKKVVAFEKRRSYSWAAWFFLVIGALVMVFGISVWAFGRDVIRRQTLELLGLFQQDWEIIRDFWQDTVGVFLEELPQEWLIVALVALVGLIGVVLATTVHRRRVVQRLRELASYGKIRNNKKIKKDI